MNAKWKYEDGNVAYADGTGTYDEGWYAAAPLTVEAGESPERGPVETREQAEAIAAELASDEQSQQG